VLGVPSILIALLGGSGWGLTAATTPAMLIASLVDRDGFYGPREPCQP
jgi:hypothetical protein